MRKRKNHMLLYYFSIPNSHSVNQHQMGSLYITKIIYTRAQNHHKKCIFILVILSVNQTPWNETQSSFLACSVKLAEGKILFHYLTLLQANIKCVIFLLFYYFKLRKRNKVQYLIDCRSLIGVFSFLIGVNKWKKRSRVRWINRSLLKCSKTTMLRRMT